MMTAEYRQHQRHHSIHRSRCECPIIPRQSLAPGGSRASAEVSREGSVALCRHEALRSTARSGDTHDRLDAHHTRARLTSLRALL